ncbi:hypothetical protein E4U42_005146 [Claviceps africana]|uniref:Aminoglycoside phosphotransferase domain-containing protein n=1 Tax=Claviceps africana TaxID=83212 RepID=A0A8K0NGI2_9HYPO|nr:hypothetical protein E4U42_005146 [Claviceps africana]
MAPSLDLLGRGPITIESALMQEKNVINWATYGPATDKLYEWLWEQRESIQALVKHHLALSKRDFCAVLPRSHWIRGSFNICVPVELKSKKSCQKVIFRCPMPHKLAESRYQGSIDEKLGCEVGAYIWIEENCPDIRTPFLFGFGSSDGRQYTHAHQMSIFSRLARFSWRLVYRLFRLPLLSNFISSSPSHALPSAYMILEYLGPETGEMLSNSFHAQRDDEAQRRRLFRGMSRILLSLARIPQARIGSFQFHNDGTITLTNRPLSCSMMILENEGATRTMLPSTTFACTDAYVSEAITFHDHRFLSQPNAVFDEEDCRGQMAVKTLLRVLSHQHIMRELRNGPFPLQLTDFHASNILVDKHWNVTGLIDLEWMCALPSEMLDVPYWLTGCAIDQIKGDNFGPFDRVRQEFMEIFKEEEGREAATAKKRTEITVSQVMQSVWESRGVWFWHCLSSVNAMYFLVATHLYPPKSISMEAETYVSRFWCRESKAIVEKKLADKREYDERLRELFC